MLVNAGADLEARNSYGNTAACIAVMFLEDSKNPPLKVSFRSQLLLDNVKLFNDQVLAELGANLDARCQGGATPLILSVVMQTKKNIRYLSILHDKVKT